MCHKHMLIQDPERLLEDEDLDEPVERAGPDASASSKPWREEQTTREQPLELTT